MRTKACSKCKIDKPFSEYFRDNKRKIGIRCKCKSCCKVDTYEWRERNKSEYNNYAAAWRSKHPGRIHAHELRRRYSLTVEQYNALLADQGLQCKICGKQHDPSVSRGRLYVDHCHTSKKIRGLLCGACNSAIGYFNDNVAVLENAIAYIKSYQ